ncbi:MAG: hypothetical protein ACKOZW_14365 [Cyanobium sp.]
MYTFSVPCRRACWPRPPVTTPATALALGLLLPALAPGPTAAVTVYAIRFDAKGLTSTATLPSAPFVGEGRFRSTTFSQTAATASPTSAIPRSAL